MKVSAYVVWIFSIFVIVAFLRTREQPGSPYACTQETLVAKQVLPRNHRLHQQVDGSLSGVEVNAACRSFFTEKYLARQVENAKSFTAADLKLMPTLPAADPPATDKYQLIPVTNPDAFNTGTLVNVVGGSAIVCRSRTVLAVFKTAQWQAAIWVDDDPACQQALATPQDRFLVPVEKLPKEEQAR